MGCIGKPNACKAWLQAVPKSAMVFSNVPSKSNISNIRSINTTSCGKITAFFEIYKIYVYFVLFFLEVVFKEACYLFGDALQEATLTPLVEG